MQMQIVAATATEAIHRLAAVDMAASPDGATLLGAERVAAWRAQLAPSLEMPGSVGAVTVAAIDELGAEAGVVYDVATGRAPASLLQLVRAAREMVGRMVVVLAGEPRSAVEHGVVVSWRVADGYVLVSFGGAHEAAISDVAIAAEWEDPIEVSSEVATARRAIRSAIRFLEVRETGQAGSTPESVRRWMAMRAGIALESADAECALSYSSITDDEYDSHPLPPLIRPIHAAIAALAGAPQRDPSAEVVETVLASLRAAY